ncbi:Rne/Rng family ribonuclease [Actinoallomurus sp. NBC_01490]|uniref:Rne/Rng family ribonuclease n=1 Tax=Actinoallomurus sp. NBC_01490 TaxID=2903557 RepID=UPI002E35C10F|nr:Rne/Rng family ribonuclease [Actinoallomurus sp. NBC_01490]
MLDNEIGDATGGTENTGNESTGETTKVSRPRRASRPAGPPPEPEESTPSAPAGEDQARPAKTTRTRRTTRKAAAEAPEAPAAETPVKAEATVKTEPAAPAVSSAPKGPEVPDAAFQPPMVVFQPPAMPAEEAPPRRPKAESQAKPKAEPKQEAPKADEADDQADDDEGTDKGGRRRRRRGGRGRGKAREGQEAEDTGKETDEDSQQADEESADEGEEREEAGSSSSRRRRRRRRRAGGGEGDDIAGDDPPNTVVHVREPRAVEDEVQAVKGSTRLEAKKQRRREGREQGRRRPPIVTESEFLARRESVERVMVIRSEGDRTQIGILEDNVLVEHYVDRSSHQSYVGNVYLGKVQNVLPSMEAAFVDIGKGRNAVLYAGEVNWDLAGLEGQPRRIESALKSGQSVLVQVTKDPLGHKGARLTSQISLPGRYLVYVPDGSMTGISRKLPDKERTRLKQILKKVMPENAGVIVRTAAEGAAEEELARDVSRLSAQWENIKRQSKTANAPAMLYGEPDLTIRVVRDIFNEDFSKLVVQGEDAWDMVKEYVGYVAPHLADRLELWSDGEDIFSGYRVDEQIAKAMERKVWLPSGGSLVIDRTEAMTVVDVNTGKFTGQGGNLEETVTRNNLEAAEEIVHQLRLRDIGGIIVIDFIDMVLESNRDLVLRRMLECLSRDRTKHQVAEVTSLGLVQMTRKRVGGGLLESFSEPCECCNGRGIHVTLSPVEPKADKSGGSSRRRKRKGDIEKAVEDKMAQAERAKEAAKPDAGEPVKEPAMADSGENGHGAAEPVAADHAGPADHAEVSDTEPSANGRRRRSRRSPRAKSEAAAD